MTPEERAVLAPYVTNTEGDVFVLTNLPEVVKGALFSRYSRSALGLRRLLLKEFLQDPAAALRELGAAAPQAGAAAARLAVGRAQEFYDRILDGYGDDSIGELGGAHLAMENVSMIATKVLEDARIGGSPLEKSTRYVSFGRKRGGEYLFHQEPALLASRHRERYLQTCRGLFETYLALMPPLTAHVEALSPRSAQTSEAAWRRSVNARVYDALRGLLPASTLTNMGIFGNGRFFEALLVRLRLSNLGELRTLAEAMSAELGKVIPSFIRRADPGHRHFQGFAAYQRQRGETVRTLAAQVPHVDAEPRAATVALVDHDPEAEVRVLAALVYPDSGASLAEARRWAASLSVPARLEIFQRLAGQRDNRRHKLPRALETVFYTFDLVGDFGMYRDLHRHRMLTQQRQPLSTRHGFALPEEVALAGEAGRYTEAMHGATEAYEAMRGDFPEQAQYVVPMACHIRWMVHVNLRALMWLVELRSTPQGHPAYRHMAQEMFRRVQEVHPALAALLRFVDLRDYALGRLDAEQRQEDKAR
ncbi:MAG: FAD-dependent thymidylate synthase [Candidatus Lambdaproteobacteria bacterium]|nr:FAD-dependent thymidylate synthase [Candidatus Lambdaproteobacteria bacterium]